MNHRFLLLCLSGSLFFSGCISVIGPELGMTEKQWFRRTLVADLVYMEGNVKAYRSNGVYYYFHNGVLVRVDEGRLPAQKIELEIRNASSEAH